MSMKNKKSYRILALLLCFMFMFAVGCTGGAGEDDGDDDTNGGDYKSLDQVKVISRPGDYDFSDAVGENSQYFYNLFSSSIVKNLYEFYAGVNTDLHKANGLGSDQAQKLRDALYANFDYSNGLSYKKGGVSEVSADPDTFGSSENDFYYVFDAPRYSIEKIEVKEENGEKKLVITVDTASKWLWSLASDSTNAENKNIFQILDENDVDSSYSNGVYTGNYNSFDDLIDRIKSVQWGKDEILKNVLNDKIGKAYVDVTKNSENIKIKYNNSPFYEKMVENAEITAKNYFQDAFEYAVYMTVLGYDYKSEADAGYFDFNISYGADGFVSDIKVLWAGQQTSIIDALQNAKELYKKTANFVGITTENRAKLIDFIKDKVLGVNALAKGQYSIVTREYGTAGEVLSTSEVKINKNYDIFAENLVTFACSEAAIGTDGESPLSLSEPFLASQITDYKGDYFKIDENDEGRDPFAHIDATEYQALILSPNQENIGQYFMDLMLAFEYYDYENGDNKGADYADELVLNVGVRYFDCNANGGDGDYVFNQESQIKVKYGRFGTFKDADGEDDEEANCFYIGYCPDEDLKEYYDVALDNTFKFESKFNDNEYIKAEAADGEKKSSRLITGTSKTREYFKLNQSSSYGSYGTLNNAKFSKNNGGAEASSYFEIYFDIVKVKGEAKNYNFKVGIMTFETDIDLD